MKTSPILFAFLLLTFPGYHHAQELGPGNVCFVRIVNAIGLPTPTQVSFRPGEIQWNEMAEGAGAMRAIKVSAPFTLAIANEGCVNPEVSDTVELRGGQYVTLVLYTDAKERDGEIVHELQYSKLERKAEAEKPVLSLVSLTPIPELPIQVGGQEVVLTPKRAMHLDVAMDEEISIKHRDEVLDLVEITAPISYAVFIYQSGEGLKAAQARQITIKEDLPRSLRKDEE